MPFSLSRELPSEILFANTSITTTSPASQYWGFDASFTYGTSTLVKTAAGMIDHHAVDMNRKRPGKTTAFRETLGSGALLAGL